MQTTRAYYFCKRAFDIFGATLLTVLLSPLMLAVAVLIKLDSRGPVLFVQDRMGSVATLTRKGRIRWHPKPFRVYKFRSMQHECDEQVHRSYIQDAVNEVGADAGRFKLSNDHRVTRIGRVLRRTSLDELPQLFNVIRGEMSLVGPRPVPLYEADLYNSYQQLRFNARPGITGLWQVSARGSGGLEKMVKLDLAYISSASLLKDLEILFRTVPAVLTQRGAE